jgi:hypothetical protein
MYAGCGLPPLRAYLKGGRWRSTGSTPTNSSIVHVSGKQSCGVSHVANLLCSLTTSAHWSVRRWLAMPSVLSQPVRRVTIAYTMYHIRNFSYEEDCNHFDSCKITIAERSEPSEPTMAFDWEAKLRSSKAQPFSAMNRRGSSSDSFTQFLSRWTTTEITTTALIWVLGHRFSGRSFVDALSCLEGLLQA